MDGLSVRASRNRGLGRRAMEVSRSSGSGGRTEATEERHVIIAKHPDATSGTCSCPSIVDFHFTRSIYMKYKIVSHTTYAVAPSTQITDILVISFLPLAQYTSKASASHALLPYTGRIGGLFFFFLTSYTVQGANPIQSNRPQRCLPMASVYIIGETHRENSDHHTR